ncbi:DUF1302 domain-containing protein [Parvibaculum sp.]|uniref:DUF1302 domain-containing protein n=1 Tax=Parvibaculum sp. TaxID=2024848 RepID=UPI002C83F423|nr:DUF1302 domain-containing protein [Parvibaculum sp.]HUD51753.1 DUF1302 domain-containing protein [Parvibaculum sp.]
MRVSAGTSPVTTEQAKGVRLKSLFYSAAVAATLFAGPAHAESYKVGDVDVSIDTTVSVGATMRTSARDCSYINPVNGGCATSVGDQQGVNSDNGNLNFDQWSFTSALARATVDVEAKWQNYGVFVRPTAFYDVVYARNDMDFRPLEHDAQQQMQGELTVLDAFVYGKWDVDGHATTLRIGKQALNWGESLLIPGGVNAFQAFDVNALQQPGSELKNAMLPMPMIYASFAATDKLTIEAFWQFSYEKSKLPAAGSFFSTDDIVGEGSLPALSAPNVDNPDYAAAPGSVAATIAAALSPTGVPIALDRTGDRGQSDMNQFGVAAHYYAEDLGNGTDLGFYYVRYSSRLPFLGFTNGSKTYAQACSDVATGTGGLLDCSSSLGAQAAFAYGANESTYFFEFPSSIDMLGASFSTTVGDVAFAGEVTLTPKMPLALPDTQMNASQIDGLGASSGLSGGASDKFSDLSYSPGVNQSTLTHIDLQTWQGQFNTISSFNTSDPIPDLLGADGGVFIVNAGFVYVPDAGDYPLSRGGNIGAIGNPYAAAILANDRTNPQYATSFSSGYRMILSMDYSNPVNLPLTVSPYIAWRHDVLGYAPGPITANYVKGMKSAEIGVSADYQSRIKGSLSYTNNFGAGWYNSESDKDFITASVSYSF